VRLVVDDALAVVDAAVQGEVDGEGQASNAPSLSQCGGADPDAASGREATT
jgi:hypothetical protein